MPREMLGEIGTRRLSRRDVLKLLGTCGIPLALLVLLAAALRWRVLQVISFLLASGIHMLLPRPAQHGPADASAEWGQIAPPANAGGPAALTTSRVAVTYHPWYQDFHAKSVLQCVEQMAALGVGYVRTDVRWSDVLPDGLTPDENAIAWYRAYFTAVRTWHGMRPLIVLSSPPAAVRRLDAQGDTLLDRWTTYTDLVSARFGDLCDLYQVLNEPNNPVYSVFPAERLPEALIAASRSIKRHVPGARVAVNFLMDLWNWRDAVTSALNTAGAAIDIIGIDHYPGTWTFSSTSDWDGFVELARTVAAAGPESPLQGKRLALMETGYATNLAWLRDEAPQADYYRGLAHVISTLDAQLGDGLLLAGVYELCDQDSRAVLDPECHFGLLTSDLSRKRAFGEVRTLCRTFS